VHARECRLAGVVCVLERLYDVGNIAAVCRSAEAFGIEAVYLVGSKSDRFKPNRTQSRVSVGAERWLNIRCAMLF
jgi:tRNA G18 (ribose-2'-O)-methylase SpoU